MACKESDDLVTSRKIPNKIPASKYMATPQKLSLPVQGECDVGDPNDVFLLYLYQPDIAFYQFIFLEHVLITTEVCH